MAIATTEFESAERAGHSKDYHWTLNFGPQHPATHTTLRIVLTLDGERVVDALLKAKLVVILWKNIVMKVKYWKLKKRNLKRNIQNA